MMIVSTIDIFWTSLTSILLKDNYVNILNNLIKEKSFLLLEWLWPEDVIVIDQRFHDSITTLEEYELIPKIPHFLKTEKQHAMYKCIQTSN